MSETSLISNETAEQTANNVDTPTADDAAPATDEKVEGDKSDVVDKMYDKTPDGDTPPEGDKPPEDGDKSGKTEDGDKKLDDADKKDADTEGDKDEKKEDDKDGKAEDDEPGEPLDLSDMEFDLPEGMELNEEVLGDLGTLAGELGLKSKEDAAKFVPLGVKLIENAFADQAKQLEQTREGWRDEAAADKEIGWSDDEGKKKQLAIADRGLTAVGTPALRTLLNQTGLGDNPDVLRAFYKVGLTVSEDVVESGGSGDTAKGGLDAMYPTMAEKK